MVDGVGACVAGLLSRIPFSVAKLMVGRRPERDIGIDRRKADLLQNPSGKRGVTLHDLPLPGCQRSFSDGEVFDLVGGEKRDFSTVLFKITESTQFLNLYQVLVTDKALVV